MHIGKVLCFQFHFEGNTPLYYTKENIEVIDSRQGIEYYYYYYYHFQDLYQHHFIPKLLKKNEKLVTKTKCNEHTCSHELVFVQDSLSCEI